MTNVGGGLPRKKIKKNNESAKREEWEAIFGKGVF